jgi:hypothetical protein
MQGRVPIFRQGQRPPIHLLVSPIPRWACQLGGATTATAASSKSVWLVNQNNVTDWNDDYSDDNSYRPQSGHSHSCRMRGREAGLILC